MSELLSFGVLVVITIGLVEVFKVGFKLPKNMCPIVALAVGLALTIIGNVANFTSLTFLTGIIVGLSASGAVDQKKIIKFLK